MAPNADDLAFMETLRQVDPITFVASRGLSYAVVGLFPSEVLEESRAMEPSIEFIKVGANWCLPDRNWLSIREWLITKFMKRMALRSLELGVTGPTPSHLKNAPTLSPWIAVPDPRFGAPILVGTQSGHPTAKGPLISTSWICGIDVAGTWARIASQWYRLKDPATSEALVTQMIPMLAGLDVLALEIWQVQAFIAKEQVREGMNDV